MSTSNFVSAPSNNLQSLAMSFIGMMVAIPVSLALFSSTQQPALAQQAPSQDESYAQYAKAYAEGFAVNGQAASLSGGCSEPTEEMSAPAPAKATAVNVSYHKKHAKPMSQKQWTKTVHNSYKKYVSNKYVSNVSNVKNVDSNNTVNSSVVVSNSNGAVVSSTTSTSGSNENKTNVNNYKSNNTVASNNVSVDSHDVTIKDSFKHETTTNNKNSIKDSFNQKVDVDVKVKDSGNTTNIDKSNHHNADLDVDLHKKPHFTKS